MTDRRITDEPKFDPFFCTGFAYNYTREGEIKITTSGFISSVIVSENSIRGVFRAKLCEPYMVHSSAGKKFVYISNHDEHGFSISSFEPERPICFFDSVSAGITRIPEGFIASEEMRRYCNDNDR